MEILIKFARSLAILLLISSCANVTPVVESSKVPDFDGNELNGGIVFQYTSVGSDGDEKKEGGYQITPRARERYNAYIEKYGERFLPPIKKDFGVTPSKFTLGNYDMTLEAALTWKKMIILMKRDRVNRSDTLINKIGL